MLEKKIKYTDLFEGTEVEETFYFHLSAAEIIELEASTEGGLEETMEKLVKEEDSKAILEMLKRIVLMSYGKKEGNRFVKNEALREEFATSEAYSELLLDFFTDSSKAAEFFAGVIPKGLEKRLEALQLKEGRQELTQALRIPEFEKQERPNSPLTTRTITRREAMEMPVHELNDLFRNEGVTIVDDEEVTE